MYTDSPSSIRPTPAPLVKAEDFLALLFGTAVGKPGTLFLSHGPRTPAGDVSPWHDIPFDLSRVSLARVAEIARRLAPSEEVFFGCSIFAGMRRWESQAIRFYFLYADCDAGTIPAALPPPSIVIRTSSGRFHAFWLLHEPIDRFCAVDLNRRIALACGADPTGCDATQVLRIPQTINHKYAVKPIVMVEVWAPDHTYRPEDFGHLPAPTSTVSWSRTQGSEQIAEGERNIALHALGRSMRFHRAGEVAIRAALIAANEGQCDPPIGQDEVEAIIRSCISPPRSGKEGVFASPLGRGALSLKGHGFSTDAIRAAVTVEAHARGLVVLTTVNTVMRALDVLPPRPPPEMPSKPARRRTIRVEVADDYA